MFSLQKEMVIIGQDIQIYLLLNPMVAVILQFMSMSSQCGVIYTMLCVSYISGWKYT